MRSQGRLGRRGLHGIVGRSSGAFSRRTRRSTLRLLELLIQRRAVLDATSHELWPVGYHRLVLDVLGEQRPQVRMMPAQLMARAVAVCSDSRAQLLHLGDEVRARHVLEIVIHGTSLADDERNGADVRHRRPITRETRGRDRRTSASRSHPATTSSCPHQQDSFRQRAPRPGDLNANIQTSRPSTPLTMSTR